MRNKNPKVFTLELMNCYHVYLVLDVTWFKKVPYFEKWCVCKDTRMLSYHEKDGMVIICEQYDKPGDFSLDHPIYKVMKGMCDCGGKVEVHTVYANIDTTILMIDLEKKE